MNKILITLVVLIVASFADSTVQTPQKELYLKVNSSLPNFSSKNLNGEGRVATSLMVDSNLNLVIDFAASWCMPCLESIPLLSERVTELSKTRLIVIMTDKEWGEKQIEFIKKAGLVGSKVSVVWDKYGALKSRYKLDQALPVTYFFSHSKLVTVHEGVVDSAFLEKLY